MGVGFILLLSACSHEFTSDIFFQGDILVGVGTTRITSSRQAARAMKNAGERFILRLERPKLKGNRAPEVHFVEESVSSKVCFMIL